MRVFYGTHGDDYSVYAAMGMAPEEIKRRIEAEPEEFPVWPENWDALGVFTRLATQWRTGFAGATGLDYNVIPAVMRLCRIGPAQRQEVFDTVRQMEAAALELFAERAKK